MKRGDRKLRAAYTSLESWIVFRWQFSTSQHLILFVCDRFSLVSDGSCQIAACRIQRIQEENL